MGILCTVRFPVGSGQLPRFILKLSMRILYKTAHLDARLVFFYSKNSLKKRKF
ncbi:hypothetical protein LPICM02_60013 [Pseudolactococcus piscium]|nr:hypothetical protein LPICM02_60013 [Lactococcus piscium]